MTPEILQLGGVFILALSLIELVKFIITKYTRNGNGKVEDTLKGLLKQAELANNNHMTHIYSEIKRQTEQHERQVELLTKICSILDERKPK